MWELLSREWQGCVQTQTPRTAGVQKLLSAERLLSEAKSLLSLEKFNFTKNFNQTSLNSVTQ